MNSRNILADCPCCGYKQALSVSIKDGKELYYCHAGCPQDSLWRVIREDGLPTYQRTLKTNLPRSNESQINFIRNIWDSGEPIGGTLAEKYLRSRGLAGVPLSCFRFLAGLSHKPSGSSWPAMIASVVDVNGRLQAIHRTYLARDGHGKAEAVPARMTLGGFGAFGLIALALGVRKFQGVLSHAVPLWLGRVSYSLYTDSS